MSKIFALDAGHGGTDPGATWSGLLEKNLTLDICNRVRKYLAVNYHSIDCRLTRTKDEFVSLSDRTKKANGWKADCFVSVHINSAESTQAHGFESFVYTTDGANSKSFALQKRLHEPLAKLWKSKGRNDRGMKKANFAVVREFKGASVLLELGFIKNPVDHGLLKDSGFLQQNAEIIGDAVATYLGVTKSVTGDVTSGGDVYRVKVDGKQVGAYANHANIGREVQKAVSARKSKIEVSKVK